jgi:hypothetical protein
MGDFKARMNCSSYNYTGLESKRICGCRFIM